MKFVYKSHFKFRAKQRGISLKLATEIYENASEKFYDVLREHHIVICRMKFRSRIRNLVLKVSAN